MRAARYRHRRQAEHRPDIRQRRLGVQPLFTTHGAMARQFPGGTVDIERLDLARESARKLLTLPSAPEPMLPVDAGTTKALPATVGTIEA